MRSCVKLHDDRMLSYIDAGNKQGKAIFYFHGIPSAADDWGMWCNADLLKRLGVRLIAVDRPGVGESTFQENRSLTDWPQDIIGLADALGVDRFSVLGYSGGGPYAAVCAAQLKQRLRSTALVSSVMSFNHTELLEGVNQRNVDFLKLSIDKPRFFKFIYWQMGLLAKLAPKKYLNTALKTFKAADAAVFARREVHEAMFAAKGSARGQQHDTRLALSPWGFSLENIASPVLIWHGGQDVNASLAMGQHLAGAIPGSRLTILPDEGHISLIVNHAEQILTALVEE